MNTQLEYEVFLSPESFVGVGVHGDASMSRGQAAATAVRSESDVWALRSLNGTGFGAPEAAIQVGSPGGTVARRVEATPARPEDRGAWPAIGRWADAVGQR